MYKHLFKRIIDLIASLIAILILSPILIPVVIGLLLTGEHYVFYFQKRIGYKNQSFNIWKFATMLKESPNLGTGMHTTKRDPRILPMGGFLRQTKINELPQLFNILIGNMSIVGPRPLVDKTFEPYPQHVKDVIYNVKPGLTGIGSIVFRDEEQLLSETKMPLDQYYKLHISPYKGELELWYQKHQSFYTDMMIIFLTAWVIVLPKSELVHKIFKDLPPLPEVFKA
ncbi:sugar transferase [Ancylomarina sp. 16SWW S1-10-2]|uniref:sugar transferase n=1 Tax=Ancylomarina sp. 16SWW S1-10-2 TaxID=2499681 RepID=UPI0012ADE926|nr:sugar transferase [Ancylomarina sp. 16SWW S1-10-2]MRT94800.1 sugar transferase [Ancylomarina sp. 16SWW S1-10-2]